VINQTTNATVNITAVETGRTIYRLWKDGAAGSEYFLVENRQRVGYDRELPSDGLLIWHIDEAIASNADENHPKVALMQADGQRDLEQGNNRGDRGDPYPGTANNTAFTSTSTPHSKSYPGADTCVAVTGIGPSGATMTAALSVKCVVKRKEGVKDIIKEKDFKDRIKDRIKDFKEIKEFKEKDKEIKEKDKDFEKPGEGGGFGRQMPEQGPYGPANLEARITALEARMSVIEPFIDASLRPDLREGALAGEEDIEGIRPPLREGTPQSKRFMDSKQREW
jgi:immune inhibitor A